MADDSHATPRTEHECRLLDVVRRHLDAHNTDVERIVRDHSYLDPARWPGIAAAAPLATPGGLGTPRSATS